jgi:hypothetical protein
MTLKFGIDFILADHITFVSHLYLNRLLIAFVSAALRVVGPEEQVSPRFPEGASSWTLHSFGSFIERNTLHFISQRYLEFGSNPGH